MENGERVHEFIKPRHVHVHLMSENNRTEVIFQYVTP